MSEESTNEFFSEIDFNHLEPDSRIYSGTFHCTEAQYKKIQAMLEDSDAKRSLTEMLNSSLSRDESLKKMRLQELMIELRVETFQEFLQKASDFLKAHKELFKKYFLQK